MNIFPSRIDSSKIENHRKKQKYLKIIRIFLLELYVFQILLLSLHPKRINYGK